MKGRNLSDIDKELDELMSLTENGGGFGDPDAKEAYDRKIQFLLSLRHQEILKHQKLIMENSVNQYGLGDNIASDKVMGDKIGTQINNPGSAKQVMMSKTTAVQALWA